MKHNEDTHVGIRYPCDMCELSFMEECNLMKHQRLKHQDKSEDTRNDETIQHSL